MIVIKFEKRKAAYFVADTVVNGVATLLIKKAIDKVAPGLQDHEMRSKLVVGGIVMVVKSNTQAPVHNLVDLGITRFAPTLDETEPITTETTTE